jgi:hypothetical protein
MMSLARTEVEPLSRDTDDAGREQQLPLECVLPLSWSKNSAWRGHLTDDDALGAVDDERAVLVMSACRPCRHLA